MTKIPLSQQAVACIDRRRAKHMPVRDLLKLKRKALHTHLGLENSSPVHAQLVREIAEGRG